MWLWAHGLEGKPDGHKVTWLRAEGFDFEAPDARGMNLAQRVALYEAATRGRSDILLAGSSYGGLTSAWLATRWPERFRALLLLAPALGRREPPADAADPFTLPSTLPCTVIHGRGDAVVSIEDSRAYAAAHPHVQLVEVDDGHALSDSLPAIADALRSLDALTR